MPRLAIRVSPAEVIDRYLILVVKANRFIDPVKRKQAEKERNKLARVRHRLPHGKPIIVLQTKLLECHQEIWDAENAIRQPTDDCEIGQLARKIMSLNQERNILKGQIDELLGEVPGDMKEYRQMAAPSYSGDKE